MGNSREILASIKEETRMRNLAESEIDQVAGGIIFMSHLDTYSYLHLNQVGSSNNNVIAFSVVDHTIINQISH
jgi:hypothetical protein